MADLTIRFFYPLRFFVRQSNDCTIVCMNPDMILSVLHGWFFVLGIFGVGLGLVIFKGRQALINLMMGLYVGLLLYQVFPYLDTITDKAAGETAEGALSLVVFLVFAAAATFLFARLMPREFLEGAFETMGSKIILAILFCVLVLTLSTHYLPVSAVIDTGTPLPPVLLAENLEFLWLVLPLMGLFFL